MQLTLSRSLSCLKLLVDWKNQLHWESNCIAPSLNLDSKLMHMYGMVKDIETAHHLFEEIPNADLVAWNSIIDCHVHCRNYKQALHLFRRMLQSGVQPDDATLGVTLSACGAIGALDFGRRIHSSLIQQHTKLGESTSVSNSIIDMYAKCGAGEEAYH